MYCFRLLISPIYLNSVFPSQREARKPWRFPSIIRESKLLGVLFSTPNPCLNSVSPFPREARKGSAKSLDVWFILIIKESWRFDVPFSTLNEPYLSEFSFPLSREARKPWRFFKLLEKADDWVYCFRLLILVWIQFPPSRAKSSDVWFIYYRKKTMGCTVFDSY